MAILLARLLGPRSEEGLCLTIWSLGDGRLVHHYVPTKGLKRLPSINEFGDCYQRIFFLLKDRVIAQNACK